MVGWCWDAWETSVILHVTALLHSNTLPWMCAPLSPLSPSPSPPITLFRWTTKSLLTLGALQALAVGFRCRLNHRTLLLSTKETWRGKEMKWFFFFKGGKEERASQGLCSCTSVGLEGEGLSLLFLSLHRSVSVFPSYWLCSPLAPSISISLLLGSIASTSSLLVFACVLSLWDFNLIIFTVQRKTNCGLK